MKKEKTQNQKKEKPKYSFLSNIWYVCRLSWKFSPMMMVISLVCVPLTVAVGPLSALLPPTIVEYVSSGYAEAKILAVIVMISLSLFSINLANRILLTIKDGWHRINNRTQFMYMINHRIFDCDYYKMEDPDFDIKTKKAFAITSGNNTITERIFTYLTDIFSNIAGLVLYSILIWNISPVIVLILFMTTVVLYYAGKINANWTQKNKSKWYDKDRRINYVLRKLGDLGAAKDIRLYGIAG
jgi:hypothetical protein